MEINFVYCGLRPPNRRLLSRKTEFEFVRPYDLIPKYLPAVAEKAQEGRAFCEARPVPASPCGINSGGASEQPIASEFEKCLNWSRFTKKLEPNFAKVSSAACGGLASVIFCARDFLALRASLYLGQFSL